MLDSSKIKCYGFSYEEAEDIMYQWNPNCKPAYEGAIVLAYVDDEPHDFAEILSQIRPELNISPNAVSIYCEVGYIYPRHGVDVVVIDGIQEELENE